MNKKYKFKVGDMAIFNTKEFEGTRFYNKIGKIVSVDCKDVFWDICRYEIKIFDLKCEGTLSGNWHYNGEEVNFYKPILSKFIEEMEKKDEI